MSKHDAQIKKLLEALVEKKEDLGKKPRLTLKTNGMIKTDAGIVNINTLNTVEKCVAAFSYIVERRLVLKHTCDELGVDYDEEEDTEKINGYVYSSWLYDIKRKLKIIKWNEKEAQIKKIEATLESLKSDDFKTQDTLSEIADLLKS